MAQIYLPYDHVLEIEFRSNHEKWNNFLNTMNISDLTNLAKKHPSVDLSTVAYRLVSNDLYVIPETRYLNELLLIMNAYEKTFTEIFGDNIVKGKLTITKN